MRINLEGIGNSHGNGVVYRLETPRGIANSLTLIERDHPVRVWIDDEWNGETAQVYREDKCLGEMTLANEAVFDVGNASDD